MTEWDKAKTKQETIEWLIWKQSLCNWDGKEYFEWLINREIRSTDYGR